MILKVFDISSEVRADIIDDNQKRNIIKIFDDLTNQTHLTTNCYLNFNSDNFEESPLYYFYEAEDKENFNYNEIAEDLLTAESKMDGSRNNTIPEGLLFIKADRQNIIMMKLEKLEVIDKDTYEFKKELGREKDYFKVCTFLGNFASIEIIDKNKTPAQYWYQKFLRLDRLRDSETNTTQVIKLIADKKLYQKEIVSQNNYDQIERFTEFYLFDNDSFDKSELFNQLNNNSLIELESEDELFSTASSEIDADFDISEKAINDKYSRKIKVSDQVTITTNNYIDSIRDHQLVFDEDDKRIIIPIDDEYLDDIKEQLEIE